MSDKLLPCPCCNGKAEASEGGFGPLDGDEILTIHFVTCADCGLMSTGDTLAEAIAAWNRRYVCPDKNGDKAVRLLRDTLPHIECVDSNQSGLISEIGEFLAEIELIKETDK